MTRLLVVASAFSFRSDPFDGFVPRHLGWIRQLASEAGMEFNVALLGESWPGTHLSPEVAALKPRRVPWPNDTPRSRVRRVTEASRLLFRRSGDTRDINLAATVRAFEADIALTIGPWYDLQYRGVFGSVPTMHLYEEDVLRLPDLGTQSWRGRSLRGLELLAKRYTAEQPRQVVTIEAREERRARFRYRGARVRTLPYALPAKEWPRRKPTGDGRDVLVLGALGQERNAAGLVELLEALESLGESHMPFRLVSDSGLHTRLHPFLDLPWVQHAPSTEAAADNYNDARIALVPARVASGFKTTILQAWTCGVPVLAYSASARTVGKSNANAVASAERPNELARLLVRIWNDRASRLRLADRGTVAAEAFDEEWIYAELRRMLLGLAGTN